MEVGSGSAAYRGRRQVTTYSNYLLSEINKYHDGLKWVKTIFAGLLAVAFLSSCDSSQTVTPFEEDPLTFDLPVVEGLGNLRMTVTDGEETLYKVKVDGLRQVSLPSAESRFGWNIFPENDYTTGSSVFSNMTLYTTKGSDNWKPVNYLLNIRDELIETDPSISRLEIQAAIWALSDHIDFDPESPALHQMPSKMVQNGSAAYNPAAVQQIVEKVESEYRGYDFTDFSVYAVLVKSGNGKYGLLLESSIFRIEKTDLKELSGLTVAWDINNNGQIIGGNQIWDKDLGTTSMGNIFARAINDEGMVVGSRGNNLMLWNPGSGLSEVQMPYGDQIEAYDINNLGQIVGELITEQLVYEDEYDSVYDYEFNGFVWDYNQNIREITRNGWASGINDQGEVVGLDYTIPNRAYKWDEQFGLRGLGSFSGYSSGRPNGINNSGEVVGSILVSEEQAAKAASQKETDNDENGLKQRKEIDRFQQATRTRGIYDHSHVVEMLQTGSFESESFPWDEMSSSANVTEANIGDLYGSAGTQSEAFLWSESNGITRIGTLGGDWSTAWDINDFGQIVGYSSVRPGDSKAFIWDKEHGMLELPGFGGNSLARSVNNKGEIIGYSYDSSGNFIPVLWRVTWNGF